MPGKVKAGANRGLSSAGRIGFEIRKQGHTVLPLGQSGPERYTTPSSPRHRSPEPVSLILATSLRQQIGAGVYLMELLAR